MEVLTMNNVYQSDNQTFIKVNSIIKQKSGTNNNIITNIKRRQNVITWNMQYSEVKELIGCMSLFRQNTEEFHFVFKQYRTTWNKKVNMLEFKEAIGCIHTRTLHDFENQMPFFYYCEIKNQHPICIKFADVDEDIALTEMILELQEIHGNRIPLIEVNKHFKEFKTDLSIRQFQTKQFHSINHPSDIVNYINKLIDDGSLEIKDALRLGALTKIQRIEVLTFKDKASDKYIKKEKFISESSILLRRTGSPEDLTQYDAKSVITKLKIIKGDVTTTIRCLDNAKLIKIEENDKVTSIEFEGTAKFMIELNALFLNQKSDGFPSNNRVAGNPSGFPSNTFKFTRDTDYTNIISNKLLNHCNDRGLYLDITGLETTFNFDYIFEMIEDYFLHCKLNSKDATFLLRTENSCINIELDCTCRNNIKGITITYDFGIVEDIYFFNNGYSIVQHDFFKISKIVNYDNLTKQSEHTDVTKETTSQFIKSIGSKLFEKWNVTMPGEWNKISYKPVSANGKIFLEYTLVCNPEKIVLNNNKIKWDNNGNITIYTLDVGTKIEYIIKNELDIVTSNSDVITEEATVYKSIETVDKKICYDREWGNTFIKNISCKSKYIQLDLDYLDILMIQLTDSYEPEYVIIIYKDKTVHFIQVETGEKFYLNTIFEGNNSSPQYLKGNPSGFPASRYQQLYIQEKAITIIDGEIVQNDVVDTTISDDIKVRSHGNSNNTKSTKSTKSNQSSNSADSDSRRQIHYNNVKRIKYNDNGSIDSEYSVNNDGKLKVEKSKNKNTEMYGYKAAMSPDGA